MKPKLIYILIIFSSLSFPQDLEIEELFNFEFGSSKEEVILQWQNSKLSTFGKISQQSEDTLSLRADNFRFYNGWNFLFVNDSLFKIIFYSTTPTNLFDEVLESLMLKNGEPELLSGRYKWDIKNDDEYSSYKMSLTCLSIGDSLRIVLSITNKGLENRKKSIAINNRSKRFFEGVKGLKWKSSPLDVKRKMEDFKGSKFVSESNSELIYKKGRFAGYPVKLWKFKFIQDRLYFIELKFEKYAFNEEDDFYTLADTLNNTYGKDSAEQEFYKGIYYWWDFYLGSITLKLNSFGMLNQEVKLTFKYSKTRLQELRNN